eukprot:474353-Amphidinium_carterae.1
MQMTHPPRKAGFKSGYHGSTRTYRLWIVVCVLASVGAQEKSGSNPALNGPLRTHSDDSMFSP